MAEEVIGHLNHGFSADGLMGLKTGNRVLVEMSRAAKSPLSVG